MERFGEKRDTESEGDRQTDRRRKERDGTQRLRHRARYTVRDSKSLRLKHTKKRKTGIHRQTERDRSRDRGRGEKRETDRDTPGKRLRKIETQRVSQRD